MVDRIPMLFKYDAYITSSYLLEIPILFNNLIFKYASTSEENSH